MNLSDQNMAEQSKVKDGGQTDKKSISKSSSHSYKSVSSAERIVACIENQDDLVASAQTTIVTVRSLLETTTETDQRRDLLKELLIEQRKVSAALEQKGKMLRALPVDDGDDNQSISSEEIKCVNEAENLIQSLAIEYGGDKQNTKKMTEPHQSSVQQAVLQEKQSAFNPDPKMSKEEKDSSPQTHGEFQQPFSGQTTAMDVLLMRDQLNTLRPFGGLVRDWPNFVTSYNETKHLLSDVANMNRLRTCIVGKAEAAVADMLNYGKDPERVMTTLNKMYGNPRIIVSSLYERIEAAGAIKEGRLETVVELACIVRNLCATITNLGGPLVQYDFSLLDKLERKLSHPLLVEWGRYKLTYQLQWPSIAQFSKFMDFHASVANEVLFRPAFSGDHEEPLRRRQQTVMTHREEQNRDYNCFMCDGMHMMNKCTEFREMNVEERRNWVITNNRCFICLGDHLKQNCKHKDNEFRKCGIEGCNKKHLRMLHPLQSSENQSDNDGE